MKKTLATTALGAVLTLTSLGSAFAAEVPAQSIGSGQLTATVKVKAASNLDEAAQSKVRAIFDQVQKGTLTKEQAKLQLQEFGIDVDFDFKAAYDGIKFKGKMNTVNLDDATKAKVKANHEQAKAQLQELGVDMDVNFSKTAHGVMVKVDAAKFDNLDEAAKEKAKTILEQMRTGSLSKEQAKSQLQELGIDMNMDFSPAHNMKKETRAIHFDDATQQKVKSLFDQLKAGTITKEQMKKQLDEILGVKTLAVPVEK